MPTVDRIAGKASYFDYNGTTIPINKATCKVTRKLGDTTDSGDYDTTADMIATTQLPCTYTLEGTIEGKFRRSSTPGVIIAGLFSSLTNIPIIFGLDLVAGTILGHGNFDISDFSCEIPVDDIISFSASIKSNGTFTPNA